MQIRSVRSSADRHQTFVNFGTEHHSTDRVCDDDDSCKQWGVIHGIE
jgi:hypothetical protein